MTWPNNPVLLPSGRTTCRVQMTVMPAWRQAAATRLSRPATSAPSGAAMGESATKQFCTARRAQLADAEALTGTLAWSVAAERGAGAGVEIALEHLQAAARWRPGHLFEATAARILAWLGRDAQVSAELERLLRGC